MTDAAPERRTIEIVGVERSAFVFSHSKRGIAAGVIAAVALGVIAGIASVALSGWLQMLGFITVVLVLGSLAATWASLRSESYFALVRDGIYGKSPFIWTFVPWDSIDAVGTFGLPGQRMLGLKLRHPPLTSRGWIVRLARLSGKILGWDLAYPLSMIKSADQFQSLVEQCARDAEARPQLG